MPLAAMRKALFDDGRRDKLHGGLGSDRFSAKDGNVDLIDCGEGIDQVVAGPLRPHHRLLVRLDQRS